VSEGGAEYFDSGAKVLTGQSGKMTADKAMKANRMRGLKKRAKYDTSAQVELKAVETANTVKKTYKVGKGIVGGAGAAVFGTVGLVAKGVRLFKK